MNRRTALTGIAALTFAACVRRQRGNNSFIYVTNEGSGELSIIDESSLAVVATVPLGKRPRGIRVSPDRKLLYVALSGSPFAGPDVDPNTLPPPDRSADGIGVVDISTRKLLRVLQAGTDPEQLSLSLDGSKIYVANEDAASMSALDVNSGKVVATTAVGEEPEGVATRPDGRVVYVTSEDDGSVYAINTSDFKVAARIEVGHRPRSIAFLKDGSRAFVSLERDASVALIDSTNHKLMSTIVLGPSAPFTRETVKPMGLALAPNESTLYVSAGSNGSVFLIDVASTKPSGSIAVGGRPWGIALSRDGRRLYTANGPANDVGVIDVETRQVVKKIPVRDRPWGVVVV